MPIIRIPIGVTVAMIITFLSLPEAVADPLLVAKTAATANFIIPEPSGITDAETFCRTERRTIIHDDKEVDTIKFLIFVQKTPLLGY